MPLIRLPFAARTCQHPLIPRELKLVGLFHCCCAIRGSQSVSTVPAEPNSACFGGPQGGFSAVRDHVPLMFSNGRKDMQRQPGRMRISGIRGTAVSPSLDRIFQLVHPSPATIRLESTPLV